MLQKQRLQYLKTFYRCILGTQTGKAIQHINDVILKQANGNRENAKDVVIVITDGRAQDGPLLVSESAKLRKLGALVRVLNVTFITANMISLLSSQF